MSDEALYTLKQLAEQLGLPESTIRYYRDAFLDHIPSVGTGRRRRYPAQAVAVLRSIATSYSEGRSRAEIIAAIHERPGTRASAVTALPEKPQRTVPLEEVSNLDLLAAILDGEREQRDALWQMAKEIVRLTEVLEDQDKVLHEIADQAGVTMSGAPRIERRQAPQLASAPGPQSPDFPNAPEEEPKLRHSMAHEATLRHADAPLPEPAATPAPITLTDTVPMSTREEPSPATDDRHIEIAEVEPLPRYGAGSVGGGESDMERLRAELENERALVERLRESKLQLEHRAADAEAALEDRSKRGRPSVIRRLLGSDDS